MLLCTGVSLPFNIHPASALLHLYSLKSLFFLMDSRNSHGVPILTGSMPDRGSHFVDSLRVFGPCERSPSASSTDCFVFRVPSLRSATSSSSMGYAFPLHLFQLKSHGNAVVRHDCTAHSELDGHHCQNTLSAPLQAFNFNISRTIL